ncbi:MAG: hypothetical protein OSA89_17695 [Mariniblastus sp.]|nr:hypothetical protein [Mariniblastus sp.]
MNSSNGAHPSAALKTQSGWKTGFGMGVFEMGDLPPKTSSSLDDIISSDPVSVRDSAHGDDWLV